MRRIVALFVVVSLLGVGLAHQVEAKEEAPEGASFKIGYVDIGKVIGEYSKAKEAEKALQKEQEARQKEIDEKRKEISKLEEELKAQESVLKEKEKKKKAQMIEEKRRRWSQLFREYDLEMRSKVIEKQKEVIKEVDRTIKSFGKEEGYTLIFDARQVVYSLEGLDLTEEVIKLLNNPQKSSKNK